MRGWIFGLFVVTVGCRSYEVEVDHLEQDSGDPADTSAGDATEPPSDTNPMFDSGTAKDSAAPKDTGTEVDSKTDTATTPDAACVTTGSTCGLVPNCGCPAGQKCGYAPVWPACVTAGPKPEQAGCAVDTDCAGGLSCIGWCARWCRAASDCSAGQLCAPTPGAGESWAKMCVTTCDPLNPSGSCGAGRGCHYFGATFAACGGAGTLTGPGCTYSSECAAGFTCLKATSGNSCFKWCRIGVAGDCPTSGMTCKSILTPDVLIGGVKYGVCSI